MDRRRRMRPADVFAATATSMTTTTMTTTENPYDADSRRVREAIGAASAIARIVSASSGAGGGDDGADADADLDLDAHLGRLCLLVTPPGGDGDPIPAREAANSILSAPGGLASSLAGSLRRIVVAASADHGRSALLGAIAVVNQLAATEPPPLGRCGSSTGEEEEYFSHLGEREEDVPPSWCSALSSLCLPDALPRSLPPLRPPRPTTTTEAAAAAAAAAAAR